MSCWISADADAVIGWLRGNRGPDGAVLLATIHSIRAYFGNPAQITPVTHARVRGNPAQEDSA